MGKSMPLGSAGLALALAVLSACGGAQKQPQAPAAAGAGEAGEAGGEDQLIPEEKYDEIAATFAQKAATVSRCYAEGVESGDVERSEKGHVTVALWINRDGSARDVRVMESSFKSGKVGDCVVRMVNRWTFTTLPKPLETSHTYVLDRL
jgi:hypothetical protein